MTNTYTEGDRVYWSTRETMARVTKVKGQELTIMVPGDRLPVTTRACFVRPLFVTCACGARVRVTAYSCPACFARTK